MNTIKLFKKFFSKIEILIIIFLLTTLTALEAIGFAVLMPLISFVIEFNEQDNLSSNYSFLEYLYKVYSKYIIIKFHQLILIPKFATSML